ncbi:hypothetical protein [Candidatus Electrothrix sp.]|uniref:hypothetical protein n=1 Tax=Candidatus Electrothrix sp. TaxID=2170559 RepID=UPI004055FD14
MKKILAALIVTAFAFCVGTAFARTVKCTIETVEKEKVTMTCKDMEKVAEHYKAGDDIKMKKVKKKVVEGC